MCVESHQGKLSALRIDRYVDISFHNDGVWLSLARAPALGAGGRRFKSCHPDHEKASQTLYFQGLRGFYHVKWYFDPVLKAIDDLMEMAVN